MYKDLYKLYVNKITSPDEKTCEKDSIAMVALSKMFVEIRDIMQCYNSLVKTLAILARIINAHAQEN